MKTTSTLLYVIFCLVLTVAISSCQGDKGDIGPKGDRGDTGAQGPQGPAGQNGIGAVSYKFVVPQGGFITNIFPTSRFFYYKLPLPSGAITQDIAENGAVILFIRPFTQSMVWDAMPLNVNGYIYSYQLINNELRVTVETPIFMNFFIGDGMNYKVVIIPAIAKNGRIANLDYTDYEAVKKAYNLQD